MDWTASAMDAFSRGYLREMNLGVSVNVDDPEDFCEVFRFSFATSGLLLVVHFYASILLPFRS